jgi:tRNA(Ile)-lysidine synthase
MKGKSLDAFEKRFLDFIRKKKLLAGREKILLALSGGLDSVTLLHLLLRVKPILKLDISCVHCNFQLRKGASDKDEAFVTKLCASLNVPLFTKSFDTKKFSQQKKLSIETAARDLRYAFFAELIHTHGFSKLLTAHHQNDNAETMLFNLFRGSSILGLKGIPLRTRFATGEIIRPLFFATRPELALYAKQHKLSFRNDASNFSLDFDRNYIRHRLIPKIENRFAHKFLPNAERLSENLSELSDFITAHTNQLIIPSCSFEPDGSTLVSKAFLKPLTPFEQKEFFKVLLQRFNITVSAQLLERLVSLLTLRTGSQIVVSKSLTVLSRKNFLHIELHPPA